MYFYSRQHESNERAEVNVGFEVCLFADSPSRIVMQGPVMESLERQVRKLRCVEFWSKRMYKTWLPAVHPAKGRRGTRFKHGFSTATASKIWATKVRRSASGDGSLYPIHSKLKSEGMMSRSLYWNQASPNGTKPAKLRLWHLQDMAILILVRLPLCLTRASLNDKQVDFIMRNRSKKWPELRRKIMSWEAGDAKYVPLPSSLGLLHIIEHR